MLLLKQVQISMFSGFTGTNCEEINRCEPNPCENSGVCNNNVNGMFVTLHSCSQQRVRVGWSAIYCDSEWAFKLIMATS